MRMTHQQDDDDSSTRERVLFTGTQFSILYTFMYSHFVSFRKGAEHLPLCPPSEGDSKAAEEADANQGLIAKIAALVHRATLADTPPLYEQET